MLSLIRQSYRDSMGDFGYQVFISRLWRELDKVEVPNLGKISSQEKHLTAANSTTTPAVRTSLKPRLQKLTSESCGAVSSLSSQVTTSGWLPHPDRVSDGQRGAMCGLTKRSRFPRILPRGPLGTPCVPYLAAALNLGRHTSMRECRRRDSLAAYREFYCAKKAINLDRI
jgi:hypothetical protein